MKKQAISAILALSLGVSGICTAPVSAEENNSAAEYTVNIQLMQFHSEGTSMGNASMKPEAHIIVDNDGTAEIQIDMVSLTYLNREGYLGRLQKVTEIVSVNVFQYPTEVVTLDANILEEYTGVYDDFNDPTSDYADEQVVGKWYPKKLSIPIDFENQEDDILVQVYVPVMESIMPGGGTKFAVLDIDWDTLSKEGSIAGDVNGDGDFNIADVITLQKWLLAVPDTELKDWKAADFCEDDKLDVFDLCLMKKALVQNIISNE